MRTIQVLEGPAREFTKQNGVMIPNEILINKKLNNPAIFQKWEEFFFESGLFCRLFTFLVVPSVYLFTPETG